MRNQRNGSGSVPSMNNSSYSSYHHHDDRMRPSTTSTSSTANRKSVESAAHTTATTTLRVLAPATLQEGYQFDVMLDDRRQPFTVTVPRGGVREGQEFEIPLPAPSSSTSLETTTPPSHDEEDDDDVEPEEYHGESGSDPNGKQVQGGYDDDDDGDDGDQDDVAKPPTGRWRKSLCGCCGVLTQATFWMATVCTPILIGQLLTRLHLDWRGRATNDRDVQAMTFNRIVMSAIAVLLLGYIPVVGAIIVLLYWVGVVVWIGTNLRYHIRTKYHIPAPCCPRVCDGRCNDGLTMLLCGCCATIQMARHTHNDLEFPGYCCTTTGLPADAPVLV